MLLFPVYDEQNDRWWGRTGFFRSYVRKVSEFYERQFNSTIDSLTSIIEPILMIGLGVLALIVVISLYLPIFQMSSVIKG